MGAAPELNGSTSIVAIGEELAGRYVCERIIGEGGMGIVVRAEDSLLGRRVALKIMRPELAGDAVCRQRLLREARAVAKLTSEHIARVLDTGTLESGVPFIVFEYLEGRDLATVLHERGALPVTVAVDAVLEACEALAEAHAHELVHRDLKPENLFCAEGVDGSQRIKLLDFGISKPIGSAAPHLALTAPQAVLGSPNYMAPEQIRAHPVDARTDIWALGAILYELVTGELAFDGVNVTQICANILTCETPPVVSARRPDVPAALDTIVARCLARDPAGRFSSVAELAQALRPFASRRTVRTIDSIVQRQSEPDVADKSARPISGIAVRAPAAIAATVPSKRRKIRLRAWTVVVALGVIGLAAAATFDIWNGKLVSEPNAAETVNAALVPVPVTETTAPPPNAEPVPEGVTPPAAKQTADERTTPEAQPARRIPTRTPRAAPTAAKRVHPKPRATALEPQASPTDPWDPSSFGGRF